MSIIENRAAIVAEEQIIAICERFGYGWVMDVAANEWARKDPIGALTVGSARGQQLDNGREPESSEYIDPQPVRVWQS